MKPTTMTIILSIFLPVLACGPVLAAHPLVSDDAGTLGKGTMQIELNGDIGHDRVTSAGSTTTCRSAQVAGALGVGISDIIDLTLGYARPWGNGDVDGVPYNDAGSSDFSLTAKWQVFQRDGLAIAIKPQIGYSSAIGAPDTEHAISGGSTLIVSKEFEQFALHLNAGYSYSHHNSETARAALRSSIWSFSLGGSTEVIKERLKLVVDFGTSTNEDKTNSEMPLFGLAGLIYSLNKIVDLSAGVKLGLTEAENDLSGTFGVTLKF